MFLGHQFGQEWLWLLLAPDALTALVGGTLLTFLVMRRHRLAPPLAWVHFGAQGYAWTVSLGLALYDPTAYIGLVSMTFATGLALAFAVRLQGAGVLWGPFQFRSAKPATASQYCRTSLLQTAAMWMVFLVALPGGIYAVERSVGWRTRWVPGAAEWIVAAIIFAIGAIIGLWAGWAMTQRGEGTPLPSACAKKLVTTGSYQFVRNPMALGGIGQGIAVGIALDSPLVVVYAVVGGFWWELLARGSEERYLSETFGEEYEAYRARVRCWIPFPKRPSRG